jgi:hypothetical protein
MAARVSKEEWKANKAAEKKALESKLGNFLREAIETKEGMSDLIAHYRISGLYGYSLFNSILIKMQGGTVAQSYNKWKTLKRCVTKGQSSSINVFRPMFKKEKQVDGTDKQKLIGFKLAPVFDIKQTEGEDLEYDHNSEEVMDVPYKTLVDVMGALTKAEVVEELTGKARGYSDGEKLVVSSMSNDVDKSKTLIHEAAHHLIHTGDKKADKVAHDTAEVEAESVAYLVMSYLDLDFDLSKKYVASYKTGISTARHSLIIKTADKMIKALKASMTEDQKFLVGLAS